MGKQILLLTFSSLLILAFQAVSPIPYDYSYTPGCVPEPELPQYNGGIVVNPRLDEGLEGWASVGNAQLATACSPSGNNYVQISNISTVQSEGMTQSFNLEKDVLYTLSAWFQVSNGQVAVQAKLVGDINGNITAAWITAKTGCWTMLKGGFSSNATEIAELRFESNSQGVDVWVDNISLQPFTQEEWTLHQIENVEKVRKTKVKVEVVYEIGEPLPDVAVSVKQLHPHFPFGCTINGLIVDNPAYQGWFLEKGFKYTVFKNELKWIATEKIEGEQNYTLPDAMLEFSKSNGVNVRGHNILWDDVKYEVPWLNSTSTDKLKEAAIRRVNSVVSRYRGEFIHWDVIDENMHFNLFSSNLSGNGTEVFKLVHELDPRPILFLNEYNVIESSSIQGLASPQRYLEKIDEIRSAGYDGPLGIGLESHFANSPNFPFIRASIDRFAATGLLIWITEFDVNTKDSDELLQYIDPLLRELHSHAGVDGINVWGSLRLSLDCFAMCIIDKDFNNLPAGDEVDKFMYEFIKVPDTHGLIGADGFFEAALFYGEYEATISVHGANVSLLFNLVPSNEEDVTVIHFKI